MAIIGAHVLLYTPEAEALRSMLRDVFGWEHVDAGGGWLIFALPPAELGVHPADGPTWESGVRHQFTLMCDDIHATIRELRAKGVEFVGEPETESYGITVMLNLPGGLDVMLYEPRHAVAISAAAGTRSTMVRRRKKRPATRTTASRGRKKATKETASRTTAPANRKKRPRSRRTKRLA
jgi:hypothetical protein